MSIHIYPYLYVCMHRSEYMYLACTGTCISTASWAARPRASRSSVYIYVYTYIYTYIYIHTYIYVCIHLDTYTPFLRRYVYFVRIMGRSPSHIMLEKI